MENKARHRVTIPVVFAIPLAFILLIPAAIGIYLIDRQVEQNSKHLAEDRVLAAEIRILHLRQERIAREVDLKLCEAINMITKRDRATLEGSLDGVEEILARLGLTRAEIVVYLENVRARVNRELERRPLLGGGDCTKLPNPSSR